MPALRWPILVATLLCLVGCLGDPVGPGGTLVIRRLSPLDSVFVGAPGRPLPTALLFQVVDGQGRPVPAGAVQWTVTGANAKVQQATGVTDARGEFSAVWVLGTRASDQQALGARVQVGSHSATASVSAIAEPVEVSTVAFASHDTTTVKLGVATKLAAQATDPFGNQFTPARMRFVSLDTTLCSVDSLGFVQAKKRGFGRITVLAGSAADTAWVHPTQIVQAIIASPDTLRFHSLGQTATLNVQLLDDQGRYVGDSLPADSVAVGAVVSIQPGKPYAVRSVSNGVTPVILRAGLAAQAVQVLVNQQVTAVKLSLSRANFDALGDSAQLTSVVSDSFGAPLANQVLTYLSGDTSVAKVDPTGLVRSKGNGSTWIYGRATNGISDSVGIVVAQQVARLFAKRDSILLDALQAVLPTQVTAVDRLGSPVAGAWIAYSTRDPSIATVDSSGGVRAVSNGATVVDASHGADTVVVSVRVSQRPVRVLMSSDTLRFVALGETQVIQALAVDSLGYAVSSTVRALGISDTEVVQQIDSVTVRSRANGATRASFSVAGLPVQAAIVVSQVPASVVAAVTYGKPIVTLPVGAAVPISCQVFDRNGYGMVSQATVSASHGTVTSGQCGSATVARSGFDTLLVSAQAAQARVPLIVAASVVASSTLGTFVSLDAFPPVGTAPWAPTLLRGPSGKLELYFTAYSAQPDSTGFTRGNLYRASSLDGINYHLEGLAIPYADSICDPQGQGIENIGIAPRADGPGWRMFYAAGSNACFGWEVFSATSTDGTSWSKEPGVRLSNGNTGPKGGSIYPPYPVGEGIWVDTLPSGGWRMIVGTQEHVQPPNSTWQIAEWTSQDQLNWTYRGTVLTTRQMPPSGQGAVYSPSIRQVTAGLWRMLFTADARGTPGSVSQVWSAVSTDLETWQVEGTVVGAPGSNLYYASLVDDRLVYLRQDGSGPLGIATVGIVMP